MKISRWCSSSTSSRWWCQSASLSKDPCLSTTVLSHPHSRIAQGELHVCIPTNDLAGLMAAVAAQAKVQPCGLSLHWKPCERFSSLDPGTFSLSLSQPISGLPAGPQLWAVSNHTVTVPLQPSAVAAAIFRYDSVLSNCNCAVCETLNLRILIYFCTFYFYLHFCSEKVYFRIRLKSDLHIIWRISMSYLNVCADPIFIALALRWNQILLLYQDKIYLKRTLILFQECHLQGLVSWSCSSASPMDHNPPRTPLWSSGTPASTTA